MNNCRICRQQDCDYDCEELAGIYRERQREILRECDEPAECPFQDRCDCLGACKLDFHGGGAA